MIEPFTSSFLMPTKRFRRLSVLLAIHNNPNVSQHKMAEISRLSSSMVNNYIKKFKEEGLLWVSGKTNRTQIYHLAPAGEQELISLLVKYSTEIIQFYGSAKRELTNRFCEMAAEGVSNVALFGAAETAEVVYAAIQDTSLTVTAVVDSDSKKQGKGFNGFRIEEPQELKNQSVDAILITSFARQDEIYDCVRAIVGDKVSIKRLSDL